MQKIITVLSLVALSLNLYEETDDVEILTQDKWATFIQNEIVLVEFYAPWCGHCKSLAPEQKKAATELKAEGLKLGVVDATVEKELAENYEVKGFPTLKVFVNGQPSDYNGGRTSEAIVSYLRMTKGTSVSTVEEVEKLNTKHVFLLASANITTEMQAKLREVGLENAELANFANLKDLSVVANVTENSLVFIPKEGKVTDAVVLASVVVDTLKEQVDLKLESLIPLVGEVNEENQMMYHKRGLDFAWLIVKKDDKLNEYVKALEQAAEPFKTKQSFVYLDDERYPGMKEQFGLKSTPGFVMTKDNKNQVFDQEFSAANLTTFVTNFDNGSLTPHMKSEDVAKDTFEGGVRVVTGNLFKEDVIDRDEDVFVFFYAPWCGHCNKAKPDYEKLGTAIKDISGVQIVKVDSTANDVDHDKVTINGFPTFQLFKKGDKANPVLYEGGRTAKDWLEYLQKEAVNKDVIANVTV